MNGVILKLIAIITMLIDHTTAVLIPYQTAPTLYIIGRTVGRLAFPIFCFLLVEGLINTKDVKNYLLRLGLFAILSELPFDMAFYNSTSNMQHQNIFFTLFIGLMVIFFIRKLEGLRAEKEMILSFRVFSILLEIIIVLAGCFTANLLVTDYSAYGILQIVIFYLFRNKKGLLFIGIFLINQMLGFGFQLTESLQTTIRSLIPLVTSVSIQSYATLSLVLIFRYNGDRGPKLNKYIFYAFYPMHLFILYIINMIKVS
jgi:hypothetical protein